VLETHPGTRQEKIAWPSSLRCCQAHHDGGNCFLRSWMEWLWRKGGLSVPSGSHQLERVWMLMALALTSPSFLTKFASSDTAADIAAGSVPGPQLRRIWSRFGRCSLTVRRHAQSPRGLSRLRPLTLLVPSLSPRLTVIIIQPLAQRCREREGLSSRGSWTSACPVRDPLTCNPLQHLVPSGIASEPPAFIPNNCRGEILLCGPRQQVL
jgi:hypothetical protein